MQSAYIFKVLHLHLHMPMSKWRRGKRLQKGKDLKVRATGHWPCIELSGYCVWGKKNWSIVPEVPDGARLGWVP